MTQETKHTPLPWSYLPRDDVNHPFGIISGDPENNGYSVAAIWAFSCDNEEENAKFIVRACNSHQALVDALQNLLNGIQTKAITSEHDETFANAIAQAEAAINLARGE